MKSSSWQWDKMLILAPASGRQPKSQLRWSNELGDQTSGASEALMASSGLKRSAGSLLQLGLCAFPTPPGWVSELIRNAGGTFR